MAEQWIEARSMRRFAAAACVGLALLGGGGTAMAQTGVVGILEGRATLLRPAGKFELAEGVELRDADIIETTPGAFVQIELPDGVRIGLGESSGLLVAPPTAAAAVGPVRARLLRGWMKLTAGADKPLAGEFVTPRVALAGLTGTTVLNTDSTQFALFVESGSITYTERTGAAPARNGKAGDFVYARSGTALASAARPSAEFVDRMPRPFRDALPARAARFRDRPVAPRELGEVAYDDVAAWLQAEEAIRVPMIEPWRVRLADKSFRAAVLAHLARHPEWRPLVVPPKKPEPKPRIVERPVERPVERSVEPGAEKASAPS